MADDSQRSTFLDEYVTVISKIGTADTKSRTAGLKHMQPLQCDPSAATFLDRLALIISFQSQTPVFAVTLQTSLSAQFLVSTNSNYKGIKSDARCNRIPAHLNSILALLAKASSLPPHQNTWEDPFIGEELTSRLHFFCWSKFSDLVHRQEARSDLSLGRRSQKFEHVITALQKQFKAPSESFTAVLRQSDLPAGFSAINHAGFLETLIDLWDELVAALAEQKQIAQHIHFDIADLAILANIRSVTAILSKISRALFELGDSMETVKLMLTGFDVIATATVSLPGGKPFLIGRYIGKVLDINFHAAMLLHFASQDAFKKLVQLIGLDSSGNLRPMMCKFIQGQCSNDRFAPNLEDPHFLKDALA